MNKIGNSFDSLNTLREALQIEEDRLNAELEASEEKLRKEREQQYIEFWKTHGFKTFEEVIEYLKESKVTIGECASYYKYIPEKDLIKYTHQCSDEFDAVFWWEEEYLTDKEFLQHFEKHIKYMADTYHMTREEIIYNEYGYIHYFNKVMTPDDYKKYDLVSI